MRPIIRIAAFAAAVAVLATPVSAQWDSMPAFTPFQSPAAAAQDTATPAVVHDSSTTVDSNDTATPVRLEAMDTVKQDTASQPAAAKPAAAAPAGTGFADTLGGNLPRVIAASPRPYLVVSDVYVPSGKTVKIEDGAVLLFKNFTGMQVEGRLLAEGTSGRGIVFSSELDQQYNPSAALHANAYDWNGIYIHEGGLGSSLSRCAIRYSVYGVSSLTKYIKIDKVAFSDNGRSDLVVEGKTHIVGGKSYSYGLTLDDAKRDGVPVKILMDPNAKKRSVLRFGGLGLSVGGMVMGVWSAIELNKNQRWLSTLSDSTVADNQSVTVKYRTSDWDKAQRDRNRSRWLTASGFALALIGGAGLGFSYTF